MSFADDMTVQGMVEHRFYAHGAVDLSHALGCPGCDPAAQSRPELAPWFVVETKWSAKGEPPRCPVRRREWCLARGIAPEVEGAARPAQLAPATPAGPAKRPPRSRARTRGVHGQGSLF